jgi:SAM-dependent methyltransferase
MLDRIIARSLKRPEGLLGMYASRFYRGNKPEYDELERIVDLGKVAKCLEIGYGLGYGIGQYAGSYGGKFDGIDISQLMHSKATKANAELIRDGRIELFRGDFLEWEAGARTYDLVICLNVVYFWPDLDKAFSRIFSLLDERGSVVVFMASDDRIRNGRFGRTDAFEKHGIEEVKLKMEGQNLHVERTVEHSEEDGRYYLIAKKRDAGGRLA